MSLDVGDRVLDKEDADSDSTAVVVKPTSTPAMDYKIQLDSGVETVASLNSSYDPMSNVVSVVFEHELRRNIPKWAFLDEDGFQSAVENHQVRVYHYPRDRLSRVDRALVKGVVIDVCGVADPIGEDEGAFYYRISRGDDEVVKEDGVFLSVYRDSLDRVSASTATYAGLLEAVEWVRENRPEFGVLVRLSDEVIVKQLKGEYDVRGSEDNRLHDDVLSLLGDMPYYDFQRVSSDDLNDLSSIAVELFRNNSGSDDEETEVEYDVENVVDDEYIVDGVYAVNVSQKTCTCDLEEECEHLEAAMEVA